MARYEFLQCRAWACHWEDYQPAPGEFRKPEYGHRLVQRCANCGGFRHRLVNRVTGAFLQGSWSYRRPEGYRVGKAMSRQDFRRRYFRRR